MSTKFFNLRMAPPVQLQEMVMIREWRLVELRNGTCVLVGVVGPSTSPTSPVTYRMSSPIAAADAATRTMQTASGRVYQLIGPPALDRPAREMILRRLLLAGHGDAEDVTEPIWQAIEAATRH